MTEESVLSPQNIPETVHVVDDDHAVRRLVTALLERAGTILGARAPSLRS